MKLGDLPPELLGLIFGHLASDKQDLKAITLTSRSFLPLARLHLFAAVNFWRLADPFAQQYLPIVRKIVVNPPRGLKLWSHCQEVLDIVQQSDMHVVALTITRLVLEYQLNYISPSLPISQILAGFPSITTLIFEKTDVLTLREFATPLAGTTNNVRTLELHHVMLADFLPHNTTALPDALPTLKRLVFDSISFPTLGALPFWLALAGRGERLEDLVIDPSITSPHWILKCFGKGVRRLAMGLQFMETNQTDDGLFAGYTDVQELTVFMPPYAKNGEGPWFLLRPLLDRAIPSRQVLTIRVVVVDVSSNRVGEGGEKAADLHEVVDWAVLGRLDETLDETKFDMLERFEFVVVSDRPRATAKENALLERVEGTLASVLGADRFFGAYRHVGGYRDVLSVVDC